jgi:hypothetical protein
MIEIPNYHVIQDFNFHELPGPNQISRNLDIGVRWLGIAARRHRELHQLVRETLGRPFTGDMGIISS